MALVLKLYQYWNKLYFFSTTFKTEVQSSLPFKLTGDVSCNHAPKRQQMIDFIVATAALDIESLRSLVTTNLFGLCLDTLTFMDLKFNSRTI